MITSSKCAPRALDVGVVGCGTAGPAAALFLSRAGHHVTVYERVPEPGPVGAGFVIQPTGQSVLASLGLLPAVLSRGARIERLFCETSRGAPILDLSYRNLEPGLFGLGLHRGALFDALYSALGRASIAVRCGVDITGYSRKANGQVVVIDAGGGRHGPHDLLIVADGARSTLRETMGREHGARAQPYRWGALWFIAEDPEQRFAGRLHQVVEGTQRMLGLLPTAPHLVTFFWSLRADTFDEVRMHFQTWKREVLRITKLALPVLEQIHGPEQLTFSAYQDVTMTRWGWGSVVYLGDAGHAMSPQLGQGCNLALYDAAVLAHCIAECASVQDALAEYNHRRRTHLTFYQRATRWLTPFFQSDHHFLGGVRDVLMGPAARIPFVHREMVRSMCGTKLGFVSGSLPFEGLAGILPAGNT